MASKKNVKTKKVSTSKTTTVVRKPLTKKVTTS